ncbi:protease inhibitor I9 family protein, partial [Salmonella enterica]|uniref:protease inhibitor I9 family protein n=1 Tax=Salmonella enterica TaxID=28901 RepID=UPI003523B910
NKHLDLISSKESQISNSTNNSSGIVNSAMTQDVSLADSYIIVFKDNVTNIDDEINQASKKYGLNIRYKYKNAIKGFSAKLPAGALNGLMNNPNIDFIEQDQIMSTNVTQTSVPSWGLDR